MLVQRCLELAQPLSNETDIGIAFQAQQSAAFPACHKHGVPYCEDVCLIDKPGENLSELFARDAVFKCFIELTLYERVFRNLVQQDPVNANQRQTAA